MHTGDEKDSLITFAGFGKKTASTGSGAGATAAAAAGSDVCPAGELLIVFVLWLSFCQQKLFCCQEV